jgi:hypothetical protein
MRRATVATGLALLAGLAPACAADVGPTMEQMGPDPARAFEPPPEVARWTMRTPAVAGEPVKQFLWEKAGATTVNGRTYDKLTGTDGEAAPNVVEAAVRIDGDDFEIGTLVFDDALLGEPGIPDISLTGDQPIRVTLAPPIGVPQAMTTTGTLTIGGTPQTGTVQWTYTLVDDQATVETPQGQVGGCRHFTAGTAGTESKVEGEVWVKTGIGIVAAKYDVYFLGQKRTYNLEDFVAGGAAGEGRAKVRRDGVVGPDATSMSVSTYDAKQTWDADKNQHAKMLLETRWSDGERAKTSEPPPVKGQFTAGWGYFPNPGLVAMPFSVLNPHENGNGYKFWYIFVDQAAKNDPTPNPLGFGVEASYAPSTQSQAANSNVSMSINYAVWSGGS